MAPIIARRCVGPGKIPNRPRSSAKRAGRAWSERSQIYLNLTGGKNLPNAPWRWATDISLSILQWQFLVRPFGPGSPELDSVPNHHHAPHNKRRYPDLQSGEVARRGRRERAAAVATAG